MQNKRIPLTNLIEHMRPIRLSWTKTPVQAVIRPDAISVDRDLARVYGQVIEYIAKWKLGIRQFPENYYWLKTDNIQEEQFFNPVSAVTSANMRNRVKSFNDHFNDVLASIWVPEKETFYPEDAYNVSIYEEIGARADIVGSNTLYEIKVCKRDDLDAWTLQTLLYYTMIQIKFKRPLERIIIINYLTGNVYCSDNIDTKVQLSSLESLQTAYRAKTGKYPTRIDLHETSLEKPFLDFETMEDTRPDNCMEKICKAIAALCPRF